MNLLWIVVLLNYPPVVAASPTRWHRTACTRMLTIYLAVQVTAILILPALCVRSFRFVGGSPFRGPSSVGIPVTRSPTETSPRRSRWSFSVCCTVQLQPAPCTQYPVTCKLDSVSVFG